MDPTLGASDAAAGDAPAFAGPPDPSMIPSPPSEGALQLSQVFAGVAITLNILSTLVFGGRVWTRSFPVFRLGWDDYIISIAYVLMLVNSILLLKTVPYVFDRDPASITMQDVINSNRLAVISQPIWAWTMTGTKVSVALMLLRVEQEMSWRRFLWVMIGLQVVVCIYNNIAQALQCVPLEGAWDLMNLLVDKKCWSKDAIRINSICISSFHVVTDVIFALIPLNFLRKVQRPLRERIIIAFLMGLGIFASVASIMKAVTAANFGRTDDPNKEGVALGTWSCIEEQVAFIAACIPCLRALFQKFMTFLGITTTRTDTKPTGYGRMPGDTSKTKGSHVRIGSAIKMKSMMSRDAHSEENILASTNREGKTGEIWRTTEVRLEEDSASRNSVTIRQGGSPDEWAEIEKPRKDNIV